MADDLRTSADCWEDERRDLITVATNLLAMKDRLLAHHRSGSPPSEAFWRNYDEAKRRWEYLTDNAQTEANR